MQVLTKDLNNKEKLFSKPHSNFKFQYISTCPNTPEQLSPSSSTYGSQYSPVDKNSSLSMSFLSDSSDAKSPVSPNSNTFEIDVRPKRRKFSTVEERTLFVEGYKRKFKTEMCKNWEIRGECKFGDKCCFAHGRHELKEKAMNHIKYKTKPCKQYHQTGYCPYGQRCQYLHKEAVSPNIFFKPLEEKWNQHSYTYDMLHEVNTLCGLDVGLETLFRNIPQRPRLMVFSSNCC